MKYVVLLFLLFPTATFAQLTSENFQVDGYSVGSTQSFSSASENFETTREGGGLYEIDEGVTVETELQTKKIVGRVRSSTTTSQSGNLDESATAQPPQSDFSSTEDFDLGSTSDFQSEQETGSVSENSPSLITQIDEAGKESGASTTLERITQKFGVEILYFWPWWILLLILALYTAHKLAKRNVDTYNHLP